MGRIDRGSATATRTTSPSQRLESMASATTPRRVHMRWARTTTRRLRPIRRGDGGRVLALPSNHHGPLWWCRESSRSAGASRWGCKARGRIRRTSRWIWMKREKREGITRPEDPPMLTVSVVHVVLCKKLKLKEIHVDANRREEHSQGIPRPGLPTRFSTEEELVADWEGWVGGGGGGSRSRNRRIHAHNWRTCTRPRLRKLMVCLGIGTARAGRCVGVVGPGRRCGNLHRGFERKVGSQGISAHVNEDIRRGFAPLMRIVRSSESWPS